MQLRQLKTFVAIAETGSFHAAAEKMSITQSAVSMQMKGLEETLQLDLFERSVRPPRLSNTGLLLLEQAREIVRLYDQLLDSSPVASQLAGSIHIGSIPGASFILPETLDNLRKTYRHLQVRVQSNLTDELVNLVSQGRLDAALVTEPKDLDPQLLSRPVLNEPMLVLAARDQSGLSDVELLNGNHYISFNRKAEVSRMVEESLTKRNIKVDPIMELDTLETFQMMIMRGLGVGILPLSSIRERFQDDFYTVPFGSPALQRRLSLVQRRAHHRQVFLDTLFDALSRVADD
ncbi:MAG: LysR family transcriptional regulator [Alphaproteobacteria bacterium]|nr:LysR family transcriptional regulator [Alphaproteobacteria bacterium]